MSLLNCSIYNNFNQFKQNVWDVCCDHECLNDLFWWLTGSNATTTACRTNFTTQYPYYEGETCRPDFSSKLVLDPV